MELICNNNRFAFTFRKASMGKYRFAPSGKKYFQSNLGAYVKCENKFPTPYI